jgi:CDP-glucose 4,6-dehydratase
LVRGASATKGDLMTPLFPNPAFWQGARVLLTGHTGFKGAWALLWLRRMGADVTGFSLAPEAEPALFTLMQGEGLCRSIIADLRDRAAVDDAVKAAQPDIVLHMAAQPIVRRSLVDPIETLETNIMGTAHLLEAVRLYAKPKAIVVITSDKVYDNDDQGVAFGEGDRLGGKDPYSASKAGAEIVASSYARSYFTKMGVPLVTARCGNIVGGGDFSVDRIIPDALRAFDKGEPLVLRHPEATRPWLHVLDGVRGYLLYAEAAAAGAIAEKALNFGPTEDQPLSVARVADLMQNALGAKQGLRHEPVPGSVEMKALAVNSALSRRTLGWTDLILGDDRILWTAAWHAGLARGESAAALCDQQLSAYQALA